jgi:DNA-binding LytR/AlgR family response regulator
MEEFVKSIQVSDQLYITKEHLVIYKRGLRSDQIAIKDIYYIQSVKDYLRIVTENETYIILGLISRAEELLANSALVRVHRSYIVNKHYITKEYKKEQDVFLGRIKKHISVGRKYIENMWLIKKHKKKKERK